MSQFKTLLYLCSLALVSFVIACNQLDNTENGGSKTKFSGQIVNAIDFMSEVITPDSVYLLDHTDQDAFELVTGAITKAGEYEFTHGKKSAVIYLQPGSSLKLSVDYNLFVKSMSFEGETAAHNRYLQQKQLLDSSYPDDTDFFLMSEIHFLRETDKFRQARFNLLQSMKDSINDDAFYAISLGNLEYEWANKLMNYEHMHKKMVPDKQAPPLDTLFQAIDAIPMERPELLSSFHYINFVFNRITASVNQQLAAKTIPAYMADYEMLKASLELTNSLLKDKQVQEYMEREFLSHYENYITTEQRAELTERYGITEKPVKS